MRLNLGAFALAFGIWWGLGMFLLTWWLIGVGGVTGEPLIMERLYAGYQITPLGSVVGMAWGFVCGAVCGAVLAWLYNFFAKRVHFGADHLVGTTT